MVNSLGSIDWIPDPANGRFERFTDYTAVITMAMVGGHPLPPADISITVDEALIAVYDAVSGKITVRFPRTHYPVKSTAELAAAVAAVKTIPPLAVNDKNVIKLTTDFYANTKGDFITIGADNAENTIPYTVQGLGQYSNETLSVGILLANNNITLEGVRFDITDSGKGIPHKWSGSSYYRAALSVGRYQSAPTTSNSNYAAGTPPSKNVAIRNCGISFTADNSMLAGIHINGGTGMVEHISVTDNTVLVEAGNTSPYAVQAILVRSYAPGLSITGNGLETKNVPLVSPTVDGSNPTRNPAGALFMQIHPDNITNSDTPLISNNIINGNPTYDFFINILSHGDRVGVPEMMGNGFATPNSKWMTSESTDTGSFYKKLIDTLLPQARTGAGYGYLALYLGSPRGSYGDFVYEAYVRENGRLSAIDFWGYAISGGAYTANEVRARILIHPATGRPYNTNSQFYWTRSIRGNSNNRGTNK
jgi:hypothetical protein